MIHSTLEKEHCNKEHNRTICHTESPEATLGSDPPLWPVRKLKQRLQKRHTFTGNHQFPLFAPNADFGLSIPSRERRLVKVI